MKYASVILSVIIVGALIALGGVFYYWVFSIAEFPPFVRIIVAVIAGAGIIALAAVGIARIREIKGGEENDLGKY